MEADEGAMARDDVEHRDDRVARAKEMDGAAGGDGASHVERGLADGRLLRAFDASDEGFDLLQIRFGRHKRPS
jgi:hypothetical protein